MKRELVRTNGFVRAAKRYSKKNVQSVADIESALTLLAADAFDPRLKTHNSRASWTAFGRVAGYDLRIVFEFVQQEGKEAILLLSMGTHDEVY